MTNVSTLKCGCCFIISLDVLRELAQGEKIETADRATYQRAYAMTQKLRLVREGHRLASLTGQQSGLALRATAVAKQPVEHLFDCQHGTTLPGTAIPDPTTDPAFKTVFDTTAKVAEFYKTVLGRNSVDNQGMDLVSSLNYGQDYPNAFWDGQQMVYGNGDNRVFIDFWRSARRHRPRTHARRDPARKRPDLRRPVGRPQREHQRLLRRRLRAVAGEQAGERRQRLADRRRHHGTGGESQGLHLPARHGEPGRRALPQPAAGLVQGLRPDRRCARQQRHCQPGLRRVRPEPRRQQLRCGDQGLVRRLRQRPFLPGDLRRFRPGHHRRPPQRGVRRSPRQPRTHGGRSICRSTSRNPPSPPEPCTSASKDAEAWPACRPSASARITS